MSGDSHEFRRVGSEELLERTELRPIARLTQGDNALSEEDAVFDGVGICAGYPPSVAGYVAVGANRIASVPSLARFSSGFAVRVVLITRFQPLGDAGLIHGTGERGFIGRARGVMPLSGGELKADARIHRRGGREVARVLMFRQ